MDTMVGDNTTLVKRALDAQQDYALAMREEGVGREHAIRAVIAYGEALLIGRLEHPSSHAFANWVADNQLDQGTPWSTRVERTAAMAVARIARRNGPSEFAGCTRSRPNDVMKWYRKQHPKPKTDTQLRRDASRLKQIERRRLAPKPSEDEQLAATEFSVTAKVTIAKAISIHKRRLERSFENVLGERVRAGIAAADEHVRKAYNELKPRYAQLEARYAELQRVRGVFTRAEFRQLLMCCHPDASAGPEIRARLTDILVKNEPKLIKGD